MRILVVEDEQDLNRILAKTLTAEGYSVDACFDGVEALDYLLRRGAHAQREHGLPSVLLLDIKMPRMDGLEVLKHIRSDEKLKHLQVVILSSSREESDLARSWDLGVNAYVVKPVDIDQFFLAVKTLGTFWAVINETPVGD